MPLEQLRRLEEALLRGRSRWLDWIRHHRSDGVRVRQPDRAEAWSEWAPARRSGCGSGPQRVATDVLLFPFDLSASRKYMDNIDSIEL